MSLKQIEKLILGAIKVGASFGSEITEEQIKINELIEVVNEQSETIVKLQGMIFKTQELLFSSLQLPKGNMNNL